MKPIQLLKTAMLLIAVALAVGGFSGCAGPEMKGPPIYDTKADGEKLLADAFAVAKRENKRVLAEFGANWCIWCHRLHTVFNTDPEIAPFFKQHYLLVMIDVNEVDGKPRNAKLIERCGNPVEKGLPGLVLFDADGNKLKVQDTGVFEHGDHYDTSKVLGFLKEWAPKPAAAN